MTRKNVDTVNITQTIDASPFTSFQIIAIVLCSFVAFLDGLDTQSIAVAAPLIADKLGLVRTALGPIFSAALLGAMIGALTFGPLGDRFGRKRCLVVAAAIFGVFTLLTSYVWSYETLLAVRFAAGIGLGGATPCFIALASEYAPRRRRAMIASLIWGAFPLGGTVGGFLNGYILANFGWPTIFLVGGLIPLVVAGVLVIWLPESIRFLLASGRDPEQVRAIVRRIAPAALPNAQIVADEEHIEGVPLKHLFSEGRAAGTLLLWVPFIMAFGTLAIVVLWTPALLRANGIALSQAAVVLGFHGIGALIGMASAGWLMEKFGTIATLVPAYILGAVATGLLGFAATSFASVSIVIMLVGVLIGMGASGAIALAALTYPTAIRSTGIGWAMGMGRFGQVLAPLMASLMLGVGLGTVHIFLATAAAPVIAAVFILILKWHAGRAKADATAAPPSPSIP
jgi:AAHS family 4-hydroxybenzoate transporter-like MFS transporter